MTKPYNDARVKIQFQLSRSCTQLISELQLGRFVQAENGFPTTLLKIEQESDADAKRPNHQENNHRFSCII
jgi:hypothetical protein